MAIRHLALGALLAGVPAAASASVFVIGSTSASLCYQAADSHRDPTREDYEHCNRALTEDALSPQDTVSTHVNRGILRLRRGDPDGAIADFDRAIALDASQPEAYLNKGSVLMRRQDYRSAMTLFTAALDRNTSRPELALYGRGVAHETLGNIPDAYADYSRASQLAPGWDQPRIELQRFRVVNR